jgi:lipopolysaccharide transport system permease protein
MNQLKTLFQYRDLLYNLVARDLKSRYRGSALGLIWTVLTPLFMALIYWVFVVKLAKLDMPMEELVIGVFAWQFTVQAIQSGLNAITGNANLVKKIYFPRIIIPLSVTLSALINYLLMLVVQLALVAVILGINGSHLAIGTAGLPVIIAYHFIFNLALALFTAAANVYFRDTQHLVGLFLSAWFFVSPVMYSLKNVLEKAKEHAWIVELYMMNPLSVIITAYRSLQLGEAFPWSIGAIIGFCWPVALFAGAYIFFQRSSRYFADWL